MNPTRSNVASVVSIKLTPRAMSFASRWDVPTNQATTAPTSGTKMRRLRMYVISSTQPRPPTLEETQSEHERDDHDDPENADPRVALDLSGLSLKAPPREAVKRSAGTRFVAYTAQARARPKTATPIETPSST